MYIAWRRLNEKQNTTRFTGSLPKLTIKFTNRSLYYCQQCEKGPHFFRYFRIWNCTVSKWHLPLSVILVCVNSETGALNKCCFDFISLTTPIPTSQYWRKNLQLMASCLFHEAVILFLEHPIQSRGWKLAFDQTNHGFPESRLLQVCSMPEPEAKTGQSVSLKKSPFCVASCFSAFQ